jgi:hypothetical protein
LLFEIICFGLQQTGLIFPGIKNVKKKFSRALLGTKKNFEKFLVTTAF